MSEHRDLHSADGRADRINSQLAGHTGESLDAHNRAERDRIRSGLTSSDFDTPSVLWELRYIAAWPIRFAISVYRRVRRRA
jgi:hypothetical protein